MRIMTFNLRFENDRDGENGWSYRRELVVEVVRKARPSILGTQEGTPGQLAYLANGLTGYRMYAPVRPEDATCQYPTLFYREDEFRAVEGGEFWLSKTPRVHRSKDWDSAFPRLMGHLLLEEIRTGRRLRAIVTHLDNLGVEARLEQSRLIVAWMRDKSEPLVLLGDFNDTPDSPCHQLFTGPEARLQDTWQALSRKEDAESMTHHGFGGIPQKWRMDWIFASSHFRVARAAILRDHRNGRYPSDHFPYMAELEWA